MKLLSLLLTLIIIVFADPVVASQSHQRYEHFKVEVIGQGKPVLLIPGFLSDQRVWDDIAKSLSKSVQVHRINISGFGSTPKVNSPSLKQTRDELLNYIETQNLQDLIVVGHSLGGFMGIWLATEQKAAISVVVSVDGLPFIGPVFTQSSEVSVVDLASQANFLKSFYMGLDSNGMHMAAARGIQNQATAEKHQKVVLEMAAMSDPATASDAIYTLMSTDLRDQLPSISARVILLGASGGFPDEKRKQQVAILYQKQLGNHSKSKVKMHTQSRHFIMFDDPAWLLNQIEAAIQEAE